MDINKLLLDNMEMYYHGKMKFIVGICEQLRLPNVFNLNLEKSLGRKMDIPYGIMAEMMIVNICDDHHPLYLLNEYYQEKDLEGIFHCPITLAQINDDRFDKFLDAFYEAGLKRLNIPKEDFHYIADSALFTAENLKKAISRNLKLITRMPETTTLAKDYIRESLNHRCEMKEIEIETVQGKVSKYFVME